MLQGELQLSVKLIKSNLHRRLSQATLDVMQNAKLLKIEEQSAL